MAKLAAFTEETGQPLRFTQSGALKIARTERDAEQLCARGRAGRRRRRRDRLRLRRRVRAAAADPRRARHRRRHVEPDGLQRRAVRAADRLLPGGGEARGRAARAHAGHGVRDRPAGCRGRADAARHDRDARRWWTPPARGRASSPRARRAAAGRADAPSAPDHRADSRRRAGVSDRPRDRRQRLRAPRARRAHAGRLRGRSAPASTPRHFAAFDVAELPLDIEVLWRLGARSVSEQFPIFQDPAIRVAEHRGGLPTLTMDDRYLRGPLPGVAGAWVMSGCCVGGLSVSPRRSARRWREWILDGAPALDLADDLHRPLRRTRSRRDRATRALPTRLRDPLPGQWRPGRGALTDRLQIPVPNPPALRTVAASPM